MHPNAKLKPPEQHRNATGRLPASWPGLRRARLRRDRRRPRAPAKSDATPAGRRPFVIFPHQSTIHQFTWAHVQTPNYLQRPCDPFGVEIVFAFSRGIVVPLTLHSSTPGSLATLRV